MLTVFPTEQRSDFSVVPMQVWVVTLLCKETNCITSVLPCTVEQVLTTPSVGHQSPPLPEECHGSALKQRRIHFQKQNLSSFLPEDTILSLPSSLSLIPSRPGWKGLFKTNQHPSKSPKRLFQCLWRRLFLHNTSIHYCDSEVIQNHWKQVLRAAPCIQYVQIPIR